MPHTPERAYRRKILAHPAAFGRFGRWPITVGEIAIRIMDEAVDNVLSTKKYGRSAPDDVVIQESINRFVDGIARKNPHWEIVVPVVGHARRKRLSNLRMGHDTLRLSGHLPGVHRVDEMPDDGFSIPYILKTLHDQHLELAGRMPPAVELEFDEEFGGIARFKTPDKPDGAERALHWLRPHANLDDLDRIASALAVEIYLRHRERRQISFDMAAIRAGAEAALGEHGRVVTVAMIDTHANMNGYREPTLGQVVYRIDVEARDDFLRPETTEHLLEMFVGEEWKLPTSIMKLAARGRCRAGLTTLQVDGVYALWLAERPGSARRFVNDLRLVNQGAEPQYQDNYMNIRDGVICGHVHLGNGVYYDRKGITLRGRDFPDIILQTLKDKPATQLVHHPCLTNTTIVSAKRRAEDIIVRTRTTPVDIVALEEIVTAAETREVIT